MVSIAIAASERASADRIDANVRPLADRMRAAVDLNRDTGKKLSISQDVLLTDSTHENIVTIVRRTLVVTASAADGHRSLGSKQIESLEHC